MKSIRLSLFVFIAIVFPIFAYAQMPFGGTVTMTKPCNTGLLITVSQPRSSPIDLMWTWGNLPYLMHIFPHPGQQVLGIASITPMPCILGYYRIGQGLPIMFHGSSI